MKKKLVLLFSLFLQTLSLAITITPTYFEQDITKSETGYKEYIIKNDSDTKSRNKMSLIPVDEKDNEYLDISIYPKVVMLEPYSEKIVKVLIKEKKPLGKDEYIFNLIAEPITIPTLDKKIETSNSVGIKGELGVGYIFEVVGYKEGYGNIKDNVKIEKVEYKNEKIELKVTNNMKRSVKLYAILYTDSGLKRVDFKRVKGKESITLSEDIKINELKGIVISELGKDIELYKDVK